MRSQHGINRVMPYSLVSRFEGCLLGLILGEQLGVAAGVSSQKPLTTWHRWHRWHPSQLVAQVNLGTTQSYIAYQVLQRMIQSPSRGAVLLSQELGNLTSDTCNAATIAIVTLPISLYYHDDLERQRQILWQVLDETSLDPSSRNWIVLFAYAIAEAIRGDLFPPTFINQAIAYHQAVSTSVALPAPDVVAFLQRMADWLADAAPCTEWLTMLTASPLAWIAIVLICFLETPEHLHTALARSAYLSQFLAQYPQPICALVGALAGAYNSAAGILPSWRSTYLMAESTDYSDLSPPILAKSLLTSWSGCYTPDMVAPLPAVAAPWMIRQRYVDR